MGRRVLYSVFAGLALFVVPLFSVHATNFTSPNFEINGTLGDSIAGQQSSTNYQMTSIGGESVAGNLTSDSYKLAEGYSPSLTQSLELNAQPSGLKAYFPFSEGDGAKTYDVTASRNAATLTEGTFSTGKVGGGLASANGDTGANAPNSTSLSNGGTEMTVSGWVKFDSRTTGSPALIRKGDEAAPNYMVSVLYSTGEIFVRSDFSSGLKDMFSDIDVVGDSQWHYFAYTCDGTNVKIYIDGELNNQSAQPSGTLNTNTDALELVDADTSFDGAIDEIKLYDRALRAEEIKAEYNANNQGNQAGLGFGELTPGVPVDITSDIVARTDANGYSLAVNQDNNLKVKFDAPQVEDDFNNISNGTNITASNSNFDSIDLLGGSSVKAQDTDTPLIDGAYANAITANGEYAFGNYNYTATNQMYYRGYFRFDQIPSDNFAFLLTRGSGNTLSEVQLRTDGRLLLRNEYSAVEYSSGTINTDEWIRVELFWDKANTTQTLRLFYGSNVNGLIPDEVLSGNATGNDTNNVRLGVADNAGGITVDVDSVGISQTGWLGPAAALPTIPSVSSTIASPATWNTGTTKGLGFTLYDTNATAIDGKWSNGNAYAALPATPTSFYTRSGATGGASDVHKMRLKLDIEGSQAVGDYESNMTLSGTITP